MSNFIEDILNGAKEKVNTAREILNTEVIPSVKEVIDHRESIYQQGASGGEITLEQGSHRRDIAEEIFGDSIDYDRVRINESSATSELNQYLPGNNSSRPYVLGNTINSSGSICDDTFIHEMMHIYQYQTGGWEYLPQAGQAAAANDYRYDHSDFLRVSQDTSLEGQRFRQFNYEQQAEIVRDYYNLTQLGAGDSITLVSGETVSYSDRNQYLELYEPFIDEIQSNRPIGDGVHLEVNEMGEEIIQEVGEAGEEISREILEGSRVGAAREVVEGGLEIGGEVVEGELEVGRELVEDGIEMGEEFVEELKESSIVDQTISTVSDFGEDANTLKDGLTDGIKSLWD